MGKKKQSKRLTNQHKDAQGVVGIFGDGAKLHDTVVGEISQIVLNRLTVEYPQFFFDIDQA